MLALLIAAALSAANVPQDTANPTCPALSSMRFADPVKMTFRLDASTGRRVLVADGKIGLLASVLLNTAIRDNQPVDELWINSPGGYAEEGMRMGQVIRKWGLPTRIGEGSWCASACTFMFLGGPIRTIDLGGIYAVHMFSEVTQQAFEPEINQAYRPGGVNQVLSDIAKVEQQSAITATEENDYMIRMGASRKLLIDIMYKQKSTAFERSDPSTIRCLTAEEERRYNVVNVSP